MQKYYITIVLACIVYGVVFSQHKAIESRHSIKGVSQFSIECQWADVIIRNWDQSDIKVEGKVNINFGENDDSFIYEFEKKGEQMVFVSDIKNMDDLPRYLSYEIKGKKYHERLGEGSKNWKDIKEELPEGVDHISTGVDIVVELIFYLPPEISFETQLIYGDLNIENCSNEMDVNNTYGHVIADFSSGGLTNECKLISTYSFVDVALPPSADVSLSLQTNYGEVFSDLELSVDKSRSTDKVFENIIIGDLNNGGRGLMIKATYNNIYLRKSS